jgi:N-methylhydantoinase A
LIDAQMAKVLRIVTIERGLDPRDFTLVAFGGNGPLHACALADEIGIARIVVPLRPGLFSAVGLLQADLRATHEHPVLRATNELDGAKIDASFARMEARGRNELRAQGADEASIAATRETDARYRGQSFELTIPYDGDPHALAARFHREHERRYGYAVESEPVEIVNLRSTSTAPFERVARSEPVRITASPVPSSFREIWIEGARRRVPVLARESLSAAPIAGPALIEQYDAVTYVAPGWTAIAHGEYLEVTQ